MRHPFVATSALTEGAFHITTMVVGRRYYHQQVGLQNLHGNSSGLHGEVSLLPFEAVIAEDTQERVATTRVRLYRSPLMLQRTMSLKRGGRCLVYPRTPSQRVGG
jgi:hypothetical protein